MDAELRDLSTTQREAVERHLGGIPGSARRGYVNAITGKASPWAAIKAMCYECMGYDRQAAHECESYSCPLFAYRPQ